MDCKYTRDAKSACNDMCMLLELGEMGEMDEMVEMVEIGRHFAHFTRATSLPLEGGGVKDFGVFFSLKTVSY